ncbi:MAG: protein kinase [Acidobacteria bacterium]|nr:protein kinase [Acidobacteriota bacterium]
MEPSTKELAPGAVIAGKYEIIRLIGYGGVGEVYLAKDTQIERLTAIKLLSKELSNDPEHRARFSRESRTVSALSHPNIITVYEIGIFNDQLFIATEFVEGKTLREIISNGPLELKDFFNVAIQATQALNVAHQNGIVHRDLKLENFILRTDGLLKVLDFGLAKVSESHSATILGSEAGFKTQAGIIMGTPNYMSPEQAKGEEIDFRSDIFSFGAVCYELLTGKLAFDGNSLVQILMSVAVVPTPPLPNNISPKLRAIVLRMLQKSPKARYQSMQVILGELISLRDELNLNTIEPKANRRTYTNLESPFNQMNRSGVNRKFAGAMQNLAPQYEQFIGRDKELQFFQTELYKLGKQQIRPAVILGDNGSGKSSLLNRFQELANQQNVLVTIINLFEQDNFAQPYQWILPMLASLVGFRFDDSLMDEEGGLAKRVNARIKARYNLTLPKEILGQNSGIISETDKWHIFDTVSEILKNLIKEKSLVLLLDNLHWANELSLELIGYLLRNNLSSKMLMIAASNSVEINRTGSMLWEWFSRQNRYTHFEIIDLKPLSLAETRAYFDAVFYQIEISDKELNYIYKITNGNVYYLNEVLRLLVQAGKIHLVSNWWHCEALESLALPDTIETALLYKIEKCSDELKELLKQASVLGDSFSFDLLARLVEIDEEKLEKLLVAAEKEHLVYEERSSKIDEYRFQSSALRDVLYNSLTKRQKKRLHARAALVIKEFYRTRVKQSFSTLTYHYHAAGEWQETFVFGQQAIEQSCEQAAWGEVVKLGELISEATTALEETSDLKDSDLDLVIKIKNSYAFALCYLGKLDLALEEAQTALTLAEKKQSHLLIAQSCATLCHLGWYTGRFTDIINWAEKGLLAAKTSKDKFWQHQLYLQSGRAKTRGAPYTDSLEDINKACSLAEEMGQEYLLAQAQIFKGLLLFLLGDYQAGYSVANNAITLLKKSGDKIFECRAYTMLGLIFLYSYQHEKIEKIYKEGVALSRQIGWRLGEVYFNSTLGRSYLLDTNLNIEKSEEVLERALILALEVGERPSALITRRGLAKIAALRGDYEDAVTQIKQSINLLKTFGEFPERMVTLETLGEVQELAGDTEEALKAYSEAEEIATYIKFKYRLWSILLGKARCLYNLGKLPEALTTLKSSEKIVAKLRAGFNGKEDGKNFFQATRNVYELIVQIENEIKTPNPKS